MLHLKDNIKLIREMAHMTQVELAKILDVKDRSGNYSSDKIYTYEIGKAKPSSSFISKLSDFSGVREDDLKDKKLKPNEIIIDYTYGEREQEDSNIKSDKSYLQEDIGLIAEQSSFTTNQAVYNLTEANRLLAEAQKVFAESNRKLADNNNELISLVKTTVNEKKQIPEVFDTMMGNLLESLAELLSDREPKNKKEVAALLSRAFHADAQGRF